MNIQRSLDKILNILEGDDALKHLSVIHNQLKSLRSAAHRYALDEDLKERLIEFAETWLVEDAIEEDPDSLYEEASDLLEEIQDQDDEVDDDEDEADY